MFSIQNLTKRIPVLSNNRLPTIPFQTQTRPICRLLYAPTSGCTKAGPSNWFPLFLPLRPRTHAHNPACCVRARGVCVCAWSADANSCSVINRFQCVMSVCEEMLRYARGNGRIDGIWMSNWCCGRFGKWEYGIFEF